MVQMEFLKVGAAVLNEGSWILWSILGALIFCDFRIVQLQNGANTVPYQHVCNRAFKASQARRGPHILVGIICVVEGALPQPRAVGNFECGSNIRGIFIDQKWTALMIRTSTKRNHRNSHMVEKTGLLKSSRPLAKKNKKKGSGFI